MNNWKEYETEKAKKEASEMIKAILFGIIRWALISAALHFVYNAVGSVCHFPKLGYWVFFWGYFSLSAIIKLIRK